MARERNPNRDKAKQIWLEHKGTITNRQIAEMLGEKEKTISVWKIRDKWSVVLQDSDCSTTDKSTNKSVVLQPEETGRRRPGAPKKNKNAAGNKGGPGAAKGNKYAVGNRGGLGGPIGNKKAVTTGEFETIWFDTLTSEEQRLFSKVDTSPLVQAEESIIFLTFRERRMMERIAKLMKGLSESELRILSELRDEKQMVDIYDAKTDSTKPVAVPVQKMVVASITETKARCIDDILKVEEALTRVQQQKARWVALKHSIENDAKGEGGDIAKEHARRLQEVWANRK